MGKFEYAYSLQGNNETPVVTKYPVAASQTLVIGDLVVLSSGKLAKAGDTLVDPVGVMMQDSTDAAAGTMVEVAVITPTQVWKATADAAATAAVLAGGKYDINATTQTVDIGDSSNGCILIHKLGASTTEVYVSFTECMLLAAS